jgi:pimeloyl-ACP methyl ester carboxylesterase
MTTRETRTADGVTLSLTEHGDPTRPTILLLHGYPDSKEVWRPVADALADRFHTVFYDVRGCGHSTAPHPLRGGFTLTKLTDDFLTVADAVSPNAPVHLVGHDWGSVQGWEFATAHRTRGRIASFTSLSGPCLDHLGLWFRKRLTRPHPRHLAQLLGQSAKSWYIYAIHIPRLPEALWRGPAGRAWPALLRRLERLPPGGQHAPAPTFPDDAAHGAWLYRDNIRPRLTHPRTDAIAHVPVQLITPTRDIFISDTLYEDIDRWAPVLERRRLPARHWVPRTHPKRLAAWITEFVTAHHRPTP